MKKILAFGASSSRKSINKQLATYAANSVNEAEVTILDLNDFEMPIFSIDKEVEQGVPQLALDFKNHLKNSNGIVVSFAEHNGAYSAAFKNIMDWISRIEKDTWASKPMLLLATSPGAQGGSTVLNIAVNKFGFMNSAEINSFSLPSFHVNFNNEIGVIDHNLDAQFQTALSKFSDAVLAKIKA